MMSLLSTVSENPYVKLIKSHVSVWLIPTVAIGALGTFYALVKPSTWEASQGFLVRDSLLELNQHGRFDTTDARKAAQETILEVARNRQVVINTLRDVVPKKKQGKLFPSDSAIVDFQDAITVTAPRGAEFGESDLIYLRVKGRSPQAAIENTNAVAKHMQRYLSYLRDRRTESISQELREKLALTRAKHEAATTKLEALEREVGSDLGELRTLNQSASGESSVRNQISQTKSELRAAQTKRTGQIKAIEFLLAAQKDPDTIVAMPTYIIEAQPALRRLKEGLVDAQLRLSDLKGKMNSSHPKVRAADVALSEIRRNVHSELDVAVRSARAELQVTDAMIGSYQEQLDGLQDRFKKIGSLRARYENLVANVRDWSEQVKEAQRALASADASLETTTSQLTLVNEPDVGDSPLGPGRLIILVASWVGGFCTGLGLLFLLVAPNSAIDGAGASFRGFGRRASDRTGNGRGRRATDRIAMNADAASDAKRQTDRRSPAARQEVDPDTDDQPSHSSQSNGTPAKKSAPFPSLDIGTNPLTDTQPLRE